MNPISLIPTPYRLLAGAVAIGFACLAIFALGWSTGAARVQAKWDKAKAVQLEASLAKERAARETERAWQTKYQGAINERTKTEDQLAAARSVAAAADDRLRRAAGDFQRRLSEAPAEAARAAAKTAAGLLGECSSRYRAMAAAAAGHLADLEQCEIAWPE
jgi:hypothetical protein